MGEKVYNVLFLCTGNSARSILAEALMNHWGAGKFRAYSAGSQPTGVVHPEALEILQRMRIPVGEPRSKSWEEFSNDDSPQMDFVFTVCDKAAGETCPVWPGQPMSAHWGVDDPAAAPDDDKIDDEVEESFAFRRAFHELESRIRIFTSLPIASLDKVKLQQRMDAIGNAGRNRGLPQKI